MIDSSAWPGMDNTRFDTNISALVHPDTGKSRPPRKSGHLHSLCRIMPAPADGKDKSLNAIWLPASPRRAWQIIFHYQRRWRVLSRPWNMRTRLPARWQGLIKKIQTGFQPGDNLFENVSNWRWGIVWWLEFYFTMVAWFRGAVCLLECQVNIEELFRVIICLVQISFGAGFDYFITFLFLLFRTDIERSKWNEIVNLAYLYKDFVSRISPRLRKANSLTKV